MYRRGGGQGFKHMYDADDSGRTRTPDLDAAAASPTPDLDAAAAAAAPHPSFNCRPGSAFATTSLAFPHPEWIMMLPSMLPSPRCSGPTDPLHLNIDDVEQLDQRNLPLFTPRLSTPMTSPVPEFPCILSSPIPAPITPQSNDLTQTAPPQKNPPQKNQAEQQAFYDEKYRGELLHAMESLPWRQPGEKKPDFHRNLQQHVLKQAHVISERHKLPPNRFSTLFNDLWGLARMRAKEGRKGGCGGGRKKSAQMNTRNNFQDFQRAVMEAVFENNRYPSQKEKARLAQEFGVEIKQVHTWFQNRRTKLRKDQKADLVDFALTRGTRKQQHMVADLVTSPVVVTATTAATATATTATTTAVVVTAATTTAIAVVTPRYSSSGGVVPVVLPLRPTPIPPPPAAVNSNASDSGLDSAGSSASISGFFNQQMLMQQMEQQIRQDCFFTRNAGAAAPYAAPYYSPPLASFFPQHHQPRQQHHQPPPQHQHQLF